MLKISKVKIYGLNDSIIASGYPKDLEVDEFQEIEDNDYNRAEGLGAADPGSGHDNYLKGIIVQFNVKYPQYWTPQFQRYNFADIVSSQSKMHMITKMNIADHCNKYVEQDIVDKIEEYKIYYNEANTSENKYYWFMKIVSNLPMGFEMTMRITTNYLQLKTIWLQRHTHKLHEDWGTFCNWILTLPNFVELTKVTK